jgi:hypothetical protein
VRTYCGGCIASIGGTKRVCSWTTYGLLALITLYTDASGFGIGAVFEDQWFSERLSEDEQSRSIAWRELFAVVVACRTWGTHLRRRLLLRQRVGGGNCELRDFQVSPGHGPGTILVLASSTLQFRHKTTPHGGCKQHCGRLTEPSGSGPVQGFVC